MKISKLFHWLYALVMLLPIFAIGVTCLVNTFNQEAKHEVENSYKYETNEVSQVSDLKVGNIYKFSVNGIQTPSSNTSVFYATDLYVNSNRYFISNEKDESYYFSCAISVNGDFVCSLYQNNSWLKNTITESLTNIEDIYFVYLSNFNTNFVSNLSESDFNILIGYQQKNFSDIFYYSVDKVTQSNLFNWAYDSFLVAPFTYIVSLFSMPANSPVVMLLSYWLAISIIWLVFDLVMYVPLLVHRWLDKGVIE